MSLRTTHNQIEFGVGDSVRVHQNVKEKEKTRLQIFEGMVIAIKGKQVGKTVTVRRIGAANIGIERIFNLGSPLIEKVEVVRKGTAGVNRSKLYYIRDKSKKEIEKIYSRAHVRLTSKTQTADASKKGKKSKSRTK